MKRREFNVNEGFGMTRNAKGIPQLLQGGCTYTLGKQRQETVGKIVLDPHNGDVISDGRVLKTVFDELPVQIDVDLENLREKEEILEEVFKAIPKIEELAKELRNLRNHKESKLDDAKAAFEKMKGRLLRQTRNIHELCPKELAEKILVKYDDDEDK